MTRPLLHGEESVRLKRTIPMSAMRDLDALRSRSGAHEGQVIAAALKVARQGGDAHLTVAMQQVETRELKKALISTTTRAQALVSRHEALVKKYASMAARYGAMMRKLRHRPKELHAYGEHLGLIAAEIEAIEEEIAVMMRRHLDESTPVRLHSSSASQIRSVAV